jgi:D-alanyl-D-alanine carboxypeptidase
MNKKSALLMLSCMFILNCSFTGTAMVERQFDKQKMDDYLSLLSENNKAILSIEIVEKGKTTYQNQTGFAYYDSTGKKVKANAQTQYRVGSITKMFTATLIMQLIEQEKLSLATPLSVFYPEIENAEEITIDHMLRHRSGLFNYTADADFREYSSKPQSQEQMITRFSGFEPVFKPGKTFSYSNTNYMLLGYIIEKITGESYQAVLQTNIIDKLNLKNTHLGSVIDTDKNQAQSFYFSRSDWQIKKQWHMSTAIAAGAIISSPHDLNIFSNALMSGKLLSKISLKKMLSSSYSYGRGTRRFPFYGRYSHGHFGQIEGFHSALAYFPEDDMSLAVCVNGLALNFNDDIAVAVLSIYYNRPYTMPDFNYQSVEIDKKLLSAFVGDYHFQGTQYPDYKMDTSLFIKNGQLFGSMPDINNPDGMALEISFVATGENTFFNASEGVQLIFKKTWYGTLNPDRFKATYNGADYYFQKK